jgi:hypothetical protein
VTSQTQPDTTPEEPLDDTPNDTDTTPEEPLDDRPEDKLKVPLDPDSEEPEDTNTEPPRPISLELNELSDLTFLQFIFQIQIHLLLLLISLHFIPFIKWNCNQSLKQATFLQ